MHKNRGASPLAMILLIGGLVVAGYGFFAQKNMLIGIIGLAILAAGAAMFMGRGKSGQVADQMGSGQGSIPDASLGSATTPAHPDPVRPAPDAMGGAQAAAQAAAPAPLATGGTAGAAASSTGAASGLAAYRQSHPSNFSGNGPTCFQCGNLKVSNGKCQNCGTTLFSA